MGSGLVLHPVRALRGHRPGRHVHASGSPWSRAFAGAGGAGVGAGGSGGAVSGAGGSVGHGPPQARALEVDNKREMMIVFMVGVFPLGRHDAAPAELLGEDGAGRAKFFVAEFLFQHRPRPHLARLKLS